MVNERNVRIAVTISKGTLELLDAVVEHISKNAAKKTTRSEVLIMSFISMMYQSKQQQAKEENK